MNKYKNNFLKYSDIAQSCTNSKFSYEQLVEVVKSNLIYKSRNMQNGEAIILLGFSGNGKTTWINKCLKNNSDYQVISMDTVHRKLYEEKKDSLKDEDIITEFGNVIEKNCLLGKNVIIDGNFLNLLTRSALTDTFHEFNYNTTLVDITNMFENTIPYRIIDKLSEDFNTPITAENIDLYINTQKFQTRLADINNHYQKELMSSNIIKQKELDILSLGTDHYLELDKNGNVKSGKVK